MNNSLAKISIVSTSIDSRSTISNRLATRFNLVFRGALSEMKRLAVRHFELRAAEPRVCSRRASASLTSLSIISLTTPSAAADGRRQFTRSPTECLSPLSHFQILHVSGLLFWLPRSLSSSFLFLCWRESSVCVICFFA